MRKEPEKVEMDLPEDIFDSAEHHEEKITLVIMMVVVFVMFFGPVTFTEISPCKGIILSAFPALSISCGAGWCFKACFGRGNSVKNWTAGKERGKTS